MILFTPTLDSIYKAKTAGKAAPEFIFEDVGIKAILLAYFYLQSIKYSCSWDLALAAWEYGEATFSANMSSMCTGLRVRPPLPPHS